MKILIIGDVVGHRSVEYLSDKLRRVRDALGVNFVVANGENAAEIHGIRPSDADELFAAGVDLITLGNHTSANGVDFFAPLNPSPPEDAHAKAFPLRSVIVTIVLLKVA